LSTKKHNQAAIVRRFLWSQYRSVNQLKSSTTACINLAYYIQPRENQETPVFSLDITHCFVSHSQNFHQFSDINFSNVISGKALLQRETVCNSSHDDTFFNLITSILKTLVILAMYSQIALFFALNRIFISANENETVKQNNQSDFKAFFN